jgi:hypothetical protein
MSNIIKMVAYAERDSYESQEDKTLKGTEDRGRGGGWRSNCVSLWRRNKGEGKVYVRGIRQGTKDGLGRTVGLAVSIEFLTVAFDQLRHLVAGGFGHGGQDIRRYPGAR